MWSSYLISWILFHLILTNVLAVTNENNFTKEFENLNTSKILRTAKIIDKSYKYYVKTISCDENNATICPKSKSREDKKLFYRNTSNSETNIYLEFLGKKCLNGDLTVCLEAIKYFRNYLYHNMSKLNSNDRVVRETRDKIHGASRQSYKHSSFAWSANSEWSQLIKFILTKIESVINIVNMEIAAPPSIKNKNEVSSPKFFDEIAGEIDIIENKKDSLFSRNRLRKILIPTLLILKLFKLKLLLLLPLILGLASFKKFLGFLAIITPALIGFFKFCKPLITNYQPPIYTKNGIGFPHYTQNGNHGLILQHIHHQDLPKYDGSYTNNGFSNLQLPYQGYKLYKK